MDPFSFVMGVSCCYMVSLMGRRLKERRRADSIVRAWDSFAAAIRARDEKVRARDDRIADLERMTLDLRAEADFHARQVRARDHTIAMLHVEIDSLVHECDRLSDEAYALLENPHEARRCYEAAAEVGCSFLGDYGRLAEPDESVGVRNAPEEVP